MAQPSGNTLALTADPPFTEVDFPIESDQITARVKRLIPHHWFRWLAPYRDAVLGGLSDAVAWCQEWIPYAALQTRLATATGVWLDIYAYDFLQRYLLRNGLSDDAFRSLIESTVLQERVTRFGVQHAVSNLVNTPAAIIEPWSTGDCGGYNTPFFAYGRAGAWGSLQLPAQAFLKVSRAGVGATGIPNVGGYGSPAAGYGVGAGEYIASEVAEIGITDDNIYRIIKYASPTGVIAWTRIGP